MPSYIIRRLLLIIPTLFGIILVNFIIIQSAPGGPVERMIAELQGLNTLASGQIGGSISSDSGHNTTNFTTQNLNQSQYAGGRGLPPELIAKIEKMYGFDQPAHIRFFTMIKNYASFNFGDSYYRSQPVVDLILDKLPVSVSLGLWSTLIIYFISIPLGIHKALKHGTAFDIWSSTIITIGYAIPSFLFAILLIVLFAGGTYLDWFPLRGLTSDHFDELSTLGKIGDYFWHITLPTLANVISGFATLTLLTKNSFLDEISKQYVVTAKAKGLNNRQILYGHVFRNAMLIIIAGFPATFISMLFTSSLLIEFIFSLDGLGLLGFEAVINRDYPVIFGSLFIFTLLGLILKLIGDLTYVAVDPRINFASQYK